MMPGGALDELTCLRITVSDLAASVAFYHDWLGLDVGEITDGGGTDEPWVGELSGAGSVRVRIAQVSLGLMRIELVEFIEPRGDGVYPLRIWDTGSVQLVLTVSDVDKVYARLSLKGARFFSAPFALSEGPRAGRRAVHVTDADGVVIELVEPIKSTERTARGMGEKA